MVNASEGQTEQNYSKLCRSFSVFFSSEALVLIVAERCKPATMLRSHRSKEESHDL